MVWLGQEEFFYQVAQGSVDGHFSLFKFGKNPNTGLSEVPIWDGQSEYTYPATAGTMGVASGSAVDNSTGTGARTLQVFGLDENWDLADEEIIMNGQTPVGTVNQYIRLFRAKVLTAGSLENQAGDIYVGDGGHTAGVPVNRYIKVTAPANQTLMALYSIPAGYEGYMTQLKTFVGKGKDGELLLKARPFGEVFQNKFTAEIYERGYESDFRPPLKFEPKTDIQMRVDMATGTVVSGSFSMVFKNI